MFKKKLCLFLAVFLLFSLSIPALASSSYQSYTIVEDEMMLSGVSSLSNGEKLVPVSEVQLLFDQRSSALISGDMKTYNEITDRLRNYGVREISLDELLRLTGDDSIPTTYSGEISSTKYTRFEYYYTTYSYAGKTYDIMRVLATPNPAYTGNSVLYHTGAVTKYNRKNAALIAVDLLGIGITSTIGIKKGGAIALTLYDVVSTIGNGLSTTSKVSNVTATYTWNLAEDCSWIYVSKHNENNYKIAARYHKGSMGVGVVIPKLVVNGMNSTAYVKTINRQVTAIPTNYDSTYQAVRAFVAGTGVYQSSITSLPVTGVECQTVTTAVLSNPEHPLYAQ